MNIRPAKNTDMTAMVALLGQLFSIEEDFEVDPERQYRGLGLLLGDPDLNLVLVAEAEGRVVGMCSVQMLISTAQGTPCGLVEDMIVDRAFRGRGIGSELLDRACKWAAEEGATRVQLLADRENTGALDFYRAQGWEQTQLICLRKILKNSEGIQQRG
jgi:ribosomal protein S18 acetylase RimI-like enzyme